VYFPLEGSIFSLDRRFTPPGKEGDAAGPEWLYNLCAQSWKFEDAWLPPNLRNLVPQGGDVHWRLEVAGRAGTRFLIHALQRTGGKTRAAQLLRITRGRLRYKMKKFHLD
jgi:hypothetical protein